MSANGADVKKILNAIQSIGLPLKSNTAPKTARERLQGKLLKKRLADSNRVKFIENIINPEIDDRKQKKSKEVINYFNFSAFEPKQQEALKFVLKSCKARIDYNQVLSDFYLKESIPTIREHLQNLCNFTIIVPEDIDENALYRIMFGKLIKNDLLFYQNLLLTIKRTEHTEVFDLIHNIIRIEIEEEREGTAEAALAKTNSQKVPETTNTDNNFKSNLTFKYLESVEGQVVELPFLEDMLKTITPFLSDPYRKFVVCTRFKFSEIPEAPLNVRVTCELNKDTYSKFIEEINARFQAIDLEINALIKSTISDNVLITCYEITALTDTFHVISKKLDNGSPQLCEDFNELYNTYTLKNEKYKTIKAALKKFSMNISKGINASNVIGTATEIKQNALIPHQTNEPNKTVPPQKPEATTNTLYTPSFSGQKKKQEPQTLGNRPKKLLEALFSENPVFKINELSKLVCALGGRIVNSMGSRIRYELGDVFGDVLEVSTLSLHRQHGSDDQNGKVSKFTINLFRSLFERAGITPKSLEKLTIENKSVKAKK